LAEELGRADLAAHAAGVLGLSASADGDLDGALRQLGEAAERARHLSVDLPPRASNWHTLMLYWTGQPDGAAERGREAVQVARRQNDVAGTILALTVAGLALASSGRYAEAVRCFDEADRFGREHGAESLVARNAAFSVGFHLDVFDYAGTEALAAQAREFGRAMNHGPAVFNPAIDLMFAFARTGRVGEAEALVPEVQAGIAAWGTWHLWQWQIRLAGARAELALARGDWDATLRFAGEAVERARAKGRVKYEAIGFTARGRALAGRGRTKAALAPLRRAVELTRPVGDPAVFLRAATALLEVDGDDALAAEARATANRILEALPTPALRSTFAAAEPVRRLLLPAA
jgi:tetratricopeptide (TPR) repeat protein